MTYDNEALLDPVNDIAGQERASFRIKRSRQRVVSRLLEHHVQVIRTHVVTVQFEKQFTHRSLDEEDSCLRLSQI